MNKTTSGDKNRWLNLKHSGDVTSTGLVENKVVFFKVKSHALYRNEVRDILNKALFTEFRALI